MRVVGACALPARSAGQADAGAGVAVDEHLGLRDATAHLRGVIADGGRVQLDRCRGAMGGRRISAQAGRDGVAHGGFHVDHSFAVDDSRAEPHWTTFSF